MVKFGKVFEPVYRVQYQDSKVYVTYLQNSTDPVIQKVINNVIKGCSNYDEIDWSKASTLPINKNVKEEVSLTDTIKELGNKYKIKLQVTDSYSKTTGVILNNNLYIPVKPSIIDMEYPYIEKYKNSDIPILSFNETIKLLNNIVNETNLPVKPVYLLLHKRDETNDIAVGILLETNRIIPIIPIKLSNIKSNIPISDIFYYPDANSLDFTDNTKKTRIKSINEYQYKIEAFERFKYEFSRYLQTPKGNPIKEKIIKIIEKPDINKKNIDELKKIITNLTKNLVATPLESKKKIEKVIEKSNSDKYESPLLRTPCFELSKKAGDKDTHCVCKGNKCKLVSLLKTDFTERLLDLLLRYPIQRYEILNGTISMIDLKKSLNKVQNGEILFTGNKLDQEFNKLIYTDKNKLKLKLLSDIALTQPTFEGVSKDDYLIERKGMEKDIKTYSVVDLSQHWLSIMDPSFRLVSTNNQCDSLYYSISEIYKIIKI